MYESYSEGLFYGYFGEVGAAEVGTVFAAKFICNGSVAIRA